MAFIDVEYIEGVAEAEFFGKAVAHYNDTIAIAQAGKIKTLKEDAGENWFYNSAYDLVGTGAEFGFSLALGPERLAVANGDGSISVYIDQGLWSEIDTPLFSPGTRKFGQEMRFRDENTLFASNHIGGDNESGLLCKFDLTQGTLIQCLEILNPDPQSKDHFGYSFDFNGTYLAIGCPGKTVKNIINAGCVYIFNINSGALVNQVTSNKPALDARFGSSVSINSTGNLLVGAYNERFKNYKSSGNAYYFQRSGLNWPLISTLQPAPKKRWGHFGQRVHLTNGGTAYIGQPGYDQPEFNQGRIFYFNSVTDPNSYEELLLSGNKPTALLGSQFIILDDNDDSILIGVPNWSSEDATWVGLVVLFSRLEDNQLLFGIEEIIYGSEEVIYSQ